MSKNIKEIHSVAYKDYPLKKYLLEYYQINEEDIRNYFRDARYTILYCDSCGLYFQKEIPPNRIIELLYEKWINPDFVYKNLVSKRAFSYYENLLAEIIYIIRFTKKQPNEIYLLDIGMGWGEWCLMAKALGCNVFGTELSKTRIQYAKKNGITILELGDIAKYKFDVINAEQVFEHLPYPLEYLTELSKSMNQDSILKINVPKDNKIRYKLKRMVNEPMKQSKYQIKFIAPLEHLNGFNYNSLVTMGKLAGLSPIKFYKNQVAIIQKPFYLSFAKAIGKSMIRKVLSILRKDTYIAFSR